MDSLKKRLVVTVFDGEVTAVYGDSDISVTVVDERPGDDDSLIVWWGDADPFTKMSQLYRDQINAEKELDSEERAARRLRYRERYRDKR